MDHPDHVNLLRAGIRAPGGVWADLGAGAGAFTLALADLLGPTAEIIAVDRDAGRLRANERALGERFPRVRTRYVVANIAEPLDLPPLDGILIANVLHFMSDQAQVAQLLRGYLVHGAPLIGVEYNIDQPHAAVPFPVPFTRWQLLARDAGFRETALLATRPSSTLREIYSVASW